MKIHSTPLLDKCPRPIYIINVPIHICRHHFLIRKYPLQHILLFWICILYCDDKWS